jgi:hypothetical protein
MSIKKRIFKRQSKRKVFLRKANRYIQISSLVQRDILNEESTHRPRYEGDFNGF